MPPNILIGSAAGLGFSDFLLNLAPVVVLALTHLFPERELELLPLDHPIYRSFYTLAGPPKIHEHDGGRREA